MPAFKLHMVEVSSTAKHQDPQPRQHEDRVRQPSHPSRQPRKDGKTSHQENEPDPRQPAVFTSIQAPKQFVPVNGPRRHPRAKASRYHLAQQQPPQVLKVRSIVVHQDGRRALWAFANVEVKVVLHESGLNLATTLGHKILKRLLRNLQIWI